MRVVVNAVAAKMGGALAYIRNFLATLALTDPENEYLVFVQSSLTDEFSQVPPNIRVEANGLAERGGGGRFLFDQWALRRIARRWKADCIFSTANFGILAPPSPQVLSVRNAAWFCRHYYGHVRAMGGRRAEMKVALRRWMVALSARSSDIVVTPSAAMRDMLLEWGAASPEKCVVIHHGFDSRRFLSMQAKPTPTLTERLARRGDEILLLYPSLYAKHKNFDTLVEALAVLAGRGRNVRALVLCDIEPAADPYQRRTWELIREKGGDRQLTMLGNQPYANMPLVYRAADLIVWPTFTESFGHPLLETMACGKPVVASDIPINREMLQEAGLYFETFDPVDSADKIEAALEPDTARRLAAHGRERVRDFSWEKHVRAFVDVFKRLSESG
jgi:glycosyltransferase involved in cell wall biosynthesis